MTMTGVPPFSAPKECTYICIKCVGKYFYTHTVNIIGCHFCIYYISILANNFYAFFYIFFFFFAFFVDARLRKNSISAATTQRHTRLTSKRTHARRASQRFRPTTALDASQI